MIDLHCHLLPGVDDGARTLQAGLELAAASVSNGITHAVLTPHIYPGVYDNRKSQLLPIFARFRDALAGEKIPLSVHLGAEVRLHPDAIDMLSADEVPFLGQLDGTRVLLVELPDGQVPPGAMTACNHLVKRGIRPMIAHPERNREFMRDPSRIRAFVGAGCLLQLTAGAIVGHFGVAAAKVSHQLIVENLVAVIATDTHNLAHRPPRLREARDAVTALVGRKVADRLVVETPGQILAGRQEWAAA